ncbi:hypothetical protein ES288_D04G140700v1 [Gossypium darwinii]|uniref:Uncharacterized protein n=1 Tax=Gossypium darwinii TaxID=34276 RepID=A0A5D2D050_GOSDA|nr:hypothetical protein ES288_D04G140700v1 [Gossypium darwinii]TYG73922.1 hypothetical protein ES288_D04G140700v1 [Gossypium darwinii]
MIALKMSALAISCRFISIPSNPFNQDFVAIFLLSPDLLSSLPPERKCWSEEWT